MRPDEWTLNYLLNSYAAFYAENEDAYRAGDINGSTCITNQEKYLDLYINALYIVFEKEELEGATIWVVEMFNKKIENGEFTSYDGTGCYLNKEGNEISGYINWNHPDNYPKRAVYVAWWNK